MLRGIPEILNPELLKVLMAMGHGDEILIADGNFPANSHNDCVIRCDGHSVEELLKAILSLMPLDTYVPAPVALMAVVDGDDYIPVIWESFKNVINEHEEGVSFEMVERMAFYERSKKASCIVATSDKALYANIILKKGVLIHAND